MLAVGRRPTKHLNLPSRLRARTLPSGRTYYYYDTGQKPRREIPLGSDYALAVKKWAELEIDARPRHAPDHLGWAAGRARAEEKLQNCEHELAKIGDGWPIPALEGEIASVTAEAVEPELARLEISSERVTQDREQAAVEERHLANELRRIETGENAIEAEECRQAAIATVGRISAEALVYHAAACLLQASLERLRDTGDGGVLRRVGTVFARITGGAYAGVHAVADEKGTPFLIAIEANGTTTKRVDQLSEGTRDQLFLALRLVMLEDYAAKAPALPFIADDLLQTFDDYGRTANALAALADLSQHMQVIVLSHHRQLIDAAHGLPGGIVNVCELAS